MNSCMASRFQLLSAAALAAALATTVNGARADLDDLVVANNALGFRLFAKLRTNEGNLFLSPYSIATCLRMVNAGARGATREELARLLQSPGDELAPAGAYAGLIERVASNANGVEVRMANGLWAQRGYHFKDDFLRLLRRDYTADLQMVDFQKAPTDAAESINRWAAEQTKGRIPVIADAGRISADDVLFLANAVYFKGDWESRFDESSTADAPFHITSERSVPVPMMVQKDRFHLFEAPDLQVLELPYVGRGYRMLVFLPRAIDGVAQLKMSFNGSLLATCLAGLKEADTQVFLPRFTLDARYDLRPLLEEMGAGSMFHLSAADFSGMAGARDLFVSAAVHQARVEVNEQGTVAVGLTAAMMTRGGIPKYQLFRADHPFLFLIFHRDTASILFLGRVVDPSR
jgi:serine protease inhibitor